jgi:hypothetical protein
VFTKALIIDCKGNQNCKTGGPLNDLIFIIQNKAEIFNFKNISKYIRLFEIECLKSKISFLDLNLQRFNNRIELDIYRKLSIPEL